MRSLCVKLAAAALVLALVVPTFAQRQGRGGRGGGFGQQAGPGLIFNKSVQEELKLTDDQKSQVTKLGEKRREMMQKAREDAGDDFAKAFQTYNQALGKEVHTILKPEQQKRFKQIEVQVGGANALNNPEIAKELNLTDKQKEEIRGILQDTRNDVMEIFKDAQGDQERLRAAGQKIQKLNQDATAKALKVLNADQQTKYKEMAGDKFNYVPEQFGRGGGRGGRGKNKQKQDK